MHETICNLAIVVIVGNLAAIAAIPVVGIFWFVVGPAIRDALDKEGIEPPRKFPRA
jgi:hypothetical protein